MDWKSIAGTVGSIAGAVAPLLTGPAGIAVSIGSQIASALGTDNSPEAVQAELQKNPEAALKLQQWAFEERAQIRENHFKLQELEHEKHKAEMLDTQNARKAHKDHWMPWAISLALFALFSAMGTALFMLSIPDGNRDLVVYLAGQVSGFLATAIVYWLGSSKGSSDKSKLLAGGK
ncbi:MAG: hypothetical protein ACPGUD_06400 [Parashewanella sp.]